jgi:hypothetical protein
MCDARRTPVVPSYIVYVDESGDEGFQFNQGSSTWFVLSAVIVAKQHDLPVVKLVDEVRATLGRKPEDHAPLHFRRLKHEHRRPLLARIATAPVTALTVLVHKPSLTETGTFQRRDALYFYTGRYLLERVSWYCRDRGPEAEEGDGTAELVISNRSVMKSLEFTHYLRGLQAETSLSDMQIDWNIIRPEQTTVESTKRMGLQLADAVASSFFYAVQLDQYGFAEDRYVRMLRPVIYQNGGHYRDFGVKFCPRDDDPELRKAAHLVWLQELYGFK